MISLDEAVEVLTGRKQLFLAWIREAAKIPAGRIAYKNQLFLKSTF
jgi:hypothetical protein